jgi:hypothetical protein
LEFSTTNGYDESVNGITQNGWIGSGFSSTSRSVPDATTITELVGCSFDLNPTSSTAALILENYHSA